MTRFEIRNSKSIVRPFYFVLIAQNEEVIATSQMYTTKEAAMTGIESVKRNAPIAEIVDITSRRTRRTEEYLAQVLYSK